MKYSNLISNPIARSVVVGAFLFFLISGLFENTLHASGKKENAETNCDVQTGPCTQSLGGGKVTLEIQPKPVKAMADLKFSVMVSGITPGGPLLLIWACPG